MKATEILGFTLICASLVLGIVLQGKPTIKQKECDRNHYLDSTYYHIDKGQLNIKPKAPEYREKYPGVYELINK
jgi:hypothetical protein